MSAGRGPRGRGPARRRPPGAGPTAPKPAGRGTSPRRIALDVLLAVDADDAYANLLLPPRLDQAGLSGPNAALATELTYGTLRSRGTYDAIIELLAKRGIEAIDPVPRAALRLGVHQLLGMRLAAHAAVNESVELTREAGARSASGFVNAILRRVAEASQKEWLERLDRELSGDARLAARFAHPAWMVGALREALAIEGAADELESLLLADNEAPRVALVALPGLAACNDVLDGASGVVAPGRWSPVALQLDHGNPSLVPGVLEGTVRVQDEGSQLVGLALAAVRPIEPGERWLDLCAGPGGKTALLAAAGAPDATVEANEVTPARAGLVRRAVDPLRLGVEVTERDGRELAAERPERYDRILVDAPCTGLGALRRRPEARWRKRPDDVGELAALQAELLDAAIAMLRPGGVVAYVTCSPVPAETVDVVAARAATGDVEVLDARAVVTGLGPGASGLSLRDRPLAGGSTVQLWPHRHGTDAMFLALLRRRDDSPAPSAG